jgi:hypothetical protein
LIAPRRRLASGSDVVVMISGAATVSVRLAVVVAAGFSASAARTVKAAVPRC